MPTTSTVDDRGIAEVVMDNPPVNALTVAGWFEVAELVTALGRGAEVRVVVLRAEGRGFNAGVDIKEMQAPEGFDALIGANRGCFAAFAAVYECAVAQGDVFLFERPDLGRTFVAYSSDVIPAQHDFGSQCHTDNGVEEGQYGTFIVDVTDPYHPQSVSFVEFPRGSHQLTIHPDSTWLYSSPSALVQAGTGQIDIADLTDPWNPVVVEPLELVTGLDSHDVIFSDDGTRAYSAALTHTLVIDTTDPGSPEVIGRILDPAINIHHEAHPYTTVDELTGIRHTFLIIVDEFAGAAGNEVCPGGGLHVYDITGHLERAPVKVGAWFVPEVGPAGGAGQGVAGLDRCTAHVLQLHPDQELMTIAWYAMGTRVLDLSGLVGLAAGVSEELGSVGTGMREVAYAHFDDGDVWATKTNRIADDGTRAPLYTRTPTLIAMTAAGLDALTGGRAILGLGASGPQVIEGWHGVPYDKPLARTREIVDICRTIWRGDRLT